MPLLNYGDVSAISYVTGDIAVLLTPQQQSFIVQAVALFQSGYTWQDYLLNRDAIDALVAGSEQALLTPMADTFGNTAIFLTPETFEPEPGYTLAFTAEAADMHGGFWTFTASALGNGLYTPYIYLKAGSWRFDLLYRKGVTAGIIKFDLVPEGGLPHALPGTVDGYNNPGLPNQKYGQTFTVDTDGMHALHLWSNTKNAASSNYAIVTQSILLRRTGD